MKELSERQVESIRMTPHYEIAWLRDVNDQLVRMEQTVFNDEHMIVSRFVERPSGIFSLRLGGHREKEWQVAVLPKQSLVQASELVLNGEYGGVAWVGEGSVRLDASGRIIGFEDTHNKSFRILGIHTQLEQPITSERQWFHLSYRDRVSMRRIIPIDSDRTR